jgi:hypothetical protein
MTRSILSCTWLLALAASTVVAGPNVWRPLGEPGSGGRITGLAVSPFDPQRVLVSGDMLGVGLSLNGGDSWRPTFGFQSWEMADFTWHPTDPNKVWVGTMSGPYLSNDGGANWQPMRTGFPAISSFSYSAPVEKVLFDPNNSSRLLAVGGSSRRWGSPGSPAWGAVWQSTDSGASWSRLSTLTANGSSTAAGAAGINVVSAAFSSGSSTRVYAAVDNQGFYRSDDGGTTWTKNNSGLPHTNIFRVVADPALPDYVYVTLGSNGTSPGGVYKSQNGGTSWTAVNSGLPRVSGANAGLTSRYEAIAVAPSSPTYVYTGDARFGTGHGVARSVNGGGSWTSILTGSQVNTFDPAGFSTEVITVDPSNRDRVFAGNSAYVLRTENGGATWDDVTSNVVPGGHVGNGFTGWVSTTIEFNPLNPNHMIVQAMDAGRVLQTKDGGASWTRKATSPNAFGGGRDVAFAGANTIYATLGQGNFQGIARSTDAGETWTTLSGPSRGLPAVDSGALPSGVYALASAPSNVWASVNGQLLRSTNGGDSWSVALTGNDVRWIQEDPNTPTRFYVSDANRVWRTENGIDFTSIGGPGKPGRMDVDSTGRLVLASHDDSGTAGNGVWRYDGTNWTKIFNDPYAVDIAVDPTNPNRIAVTTDDDPFHDVSRASGVYLTDDGGVTWRLLNTGLPMLRGSVIEFNPHDPRELVVGTSGRGFFLLTLGLSGDYNADGVVNTADYTVWRDTFGSSSDLRADGSGNGIVDDADYTTWATNFGAVSAPSSSTAVPEPAALALLTLSAALVAARERNKLAD